MKALARGYNPDYSKEEPAVAEIERLQGPAVLEFGAPWCGHCQAAAPAIRGAMAAHPRIAHIKVYDGKGQPLGRAFGVKLWPTVIVLLDGKEVERLVRPRDSQALARALETIA